MSTTTQTTTAPRQKRRISVRLRVISSMFLAMTIFFVSLILIVATVEANNLKSNFNRVIAGYAELATTSIGDKLTATGDVQAALSTIRATLALNPNVTSFAIVTPSGRVLLQEGVGSTTSSLQAASVTPLLELSSSSVYDKIVYPYMTSTGEHTYTLVYSISDSSITMIVRHTAETLIPIIIGTLLICGMLFFALANRFVLRPIRRIRDAAQAISEGHLDVEIVAGQNDEVGDLATSVGRMAVNLEGNIQKLKEVDNLKSEFIMISSHNLRTPLTEIKGYLELLQTALSDPQTKKMLETISISANRLMNFSEDMLTVASIEANSGVATQLNKVTIHEVIGSLIKEFQTVAKQQEITFDVHMDTPDVRVLANAALLRSALRNLLDNAFKFTEAAGKVTFFVHSQGSRVLVEVQDTGIGIAEAEIPKLFTKFHRGTSTVTYNYEGVGMGLYATKLILDQQHATIQVSSTLGKGSRFIVSLPAA